ncbi:bifunctional diaminohydroxyphosphoribosylaminopyrimidine deaminase/5-amino-6-(5-phosphoribosylamino)uracil reductase RibD [Inhella sp. 1Y17]|uniref:Riboflavin biosynthesis protein RibD n=2 Tax=Inhella proteolytica TaxID=2795029 RepID=A0A931NGL8_9BURK|nr:bifunctional diaminohydroxyphosphoribosylaminopyrimidine deaminase/5-amino-6-(5-phosphoribosylamino)uracil reductase RibD [Inhella proteolytica]
MAAVLDLAARAIGLSDPNPRVGCAIVSPAGELLGLGHTQQAGGPHAEVMALRDAQARGQDVQGATAYVSLEPCSHHGRTPPCCEALIGSGLARVVVALEDPNPLVAGQGLARLRAAGLQVEVGPGAAQAEALNCGFMQRMRTSRPYVRLKWASSLDGRTAHPDGRSQWVTGPAARADGHAWRKRAGAVLTGIGTVLADDPRLDVREVATARQPLRVVLDRQLRLPAQARILQGEPILIAHGAAANGTRPDLLDRGVELLELPLNEQGRLDLAVLLDRLGQRQINELHVEAGARLNGSWLAEGKVDELLVYLAPRLLGPGLGCAELPGPVPLDDAQRWQWIDACPVGSDLRLRLRRPGSP